MKYLENRLLFSPSDLVRYIQSPFASWMERLCLEQPEYKTKKDPKDALLSYLAEKGLAHEAQYLQLLKASEKSVITIDEGLSNVEKAKATIEAMKKGPDIIFQAYLLADNFHGLADFLIKTNSPSKLGNYSYEPWDTKLAKQPKAYFIIQLCCYADLLNSIQGTLPESMAIVLGTQEVVHYRTFDFWAYYKSKKSEFLLQQKHFDISAQPDPFECKDVGDWNDYVDKLRLQQDHLSKIANITRLQIKKLNNSGINTCAQFINDKQISIGRMPIQISERLKSQARLQQATLDAGEVAFELLPVNFEDPKGLAVLPPSSNNDLFFDLEGFPLEEGGLEYLWGCAYYSQTSERLFWERWAHDHEAEKNAFNDFIHFAITRWREDPDMHIYHYGHYEVSVCKRLMGRYGIWENAIDDMLRAGVFVDLYKVVQHGMILGAPSYSIKQVELLFKEKRETDVASGGESVVVYANWQEEPDGDTWETSQILSNIRDYNIDDCNSTEELTTWLRKLQVKNNISYNNIFLNSANTNKALAQIEQNDPVKELEVSLRSLELDDNMDQNRRHLAKVFADLIYFYERENKPTWWRFFERKEMSYEELFDDADCIVDCELTDSAPRLSGKTTRSALMYEYAFNPTQEFRNRRFTQAYVLDAFTGIVSINSVDDKQGRIWIKKPTKKNLPEYLSLIAYEYVNADVLTHRVRSLAHKFLNQSYMPKPIEDFLLKNPPTLPLNLLFEIDNAKDSEKLRLIIQAVTQLDNSFLSIQGPPGTGKTYTASYVITELLKQGKKVGISSNSHKAINNLMAAVAELMGSENLQKPMYKVQREDDDLFALFPVEQIETRDINDCNLSNGGLFGATAWGFANSDECFDYLFVDEAGQVSIANLLAMGHKAQNIVVMGDQMQLPQPLQGSHPGDSGLSILDYLLQDARTVPTDKGIFLNRSYRMHENVNHFISTMVYEGRLDNDPLCNRQAIHYGKQHHVSLNKANGIIPIPLNHNSNKQSSPEEVALIRELVNDLLKSQHTDKDGQIKQLTGADILVVAPFNHQVNELSKALGFNARVGTVDKFQGQEAPVVIVSMTASLATESARGADFLLSINRLNVAISRAKALAIVVYSSNLLNGNPSKIQDIRRFNFFEQLVDEVSQATVRLDV
jgi:predicted RecB family nuclease